MPGWHVTWATHNSRVSERMIEFRVKSGNAVWLEPEEETVIAKAIAGVVKNDGLTVHAFSACGDHVHLLIEAEDSELAGIVGKLKAVSAREHNITYGWTKSNSTAGHAPLSEDFSKRGETQNKLWARYFGKVLIDTPEYFDKAKAYITTNREHHGLPENKKLAEIIRKMVRS